MFPLCFIKDNKDIITLEEKKKNNKLKMLQRKNLNEEIKKNIVKFEEEKFGEVYWLKNRNNFLKIHKNFLKQNSVSILISNKFVENPHFCLPEKDFTIQNKQFLHKKKDDWFLELFKVFGFENLFINKIIKIIFTDIDIKKEKEKKEKEEKEKEKEQEEKEKKIKEKEKEEQEKKIKEEEKEEQEKE
jgi:hypothetical protein